MKKKNFLKDYFILLIFPIIFIVLAFLLDDPISIFTNFKTLILERDVLLTDYFKTGSLSSGLLNSGLTALVAIILLYYFKKDIDGITIASIFTILGFALIGKNVVNVLPIYLGGYIYSRYSRIAMKDLLIALIFATTLAPIVGEIIFHYNMKYLLNIPFGIIVGVIIGFIINPLGKHMHKFHDGYNLYNIGFTGGVIGLVIASLFRSFGREMDTVMVVSYEYHRFLLIILSLLFGALIILSYILDKKVIKNYKTLLKESGRAPNDFKEKYGQPVVFLNMGIMGFISILYVIISRGHINGPTVAGVLTIVGFSASGNHPKNSIPILMGVYLGGQLNIMDSSSASVIIAGLFGTTLAPIAGDYGFFPGLVAGFLHIAIGANILKSHGGVHLYNNGFAGGIVAAILVPIMNIFRRSNS